MTDAQFYNNFIFRKFEYNRYHMTDNTSVGAQRHYFAKMISGRARLVCEKYTVELVAGDVFYIPFGMRYLSHWYPVDGTLAFYSIGFSHLPSTIDYKMQKIEGAGEAFDKYFDDITVSCDSIAKLYCFFADIRDKLTPRCNMAQDITAMRAVNFMRNNPQADAREIASHLNISESGLYGIFRQTLNKTPLDVRRQLIIEQAENLLITTDMSIELISARLGFSSSSYFRKVFFKVTGKTPSAVRGGRL